MRADMRQAATSIEGLSAAGMRHASQLEAIESGLAGHAVRILSLEETAPPPVPRPPAAARAGTASTTLRRAFRRGRQMASAPDGCCGGACGDGGQHQRAASPNPFAMAPVVDSAPAAPPGIPGADDPNGDEDLVQIISALVSGNAECHCWHVERLIARVDALEQTQRHPVSQPAQQQQRPDPW